MPTGTVVHCQHKNNDFVGEIKCKITAKLSALITFSPSFYPLTIKAFFNEFVN